MHMYEKKEMEDWREEGDEEETIKIIWIDLRMN